MAAIYEKVQCLQKAGVLQYPGPHFVKQTLY